jgi:hypothetical protein
VPVIQGAQEVEIRRIAVRGQPEYLQTKPSQKRADVVAQDVGPEFKPQYHGNK